ncbi:MAG: amidohydrolase, partial [Thaumarchaeota archaeon]|nr:amidohydrolase [Nitrososphaerota archaeon]
CVSFLNVKIVAHHLGGMIPFFLGRISESFDSGMFVMKAEQKKGVKLSKPRVTDYFREFYYDTAVGGSASAIKCGYDVFGSKHLLFSTDYPWGPDNGRARLASYSKILKGIGFPKDDLFDIQEGNARQLFGL